MQNILSIAAVLKQKQIPFVMITLTGTRGYTPQDVGAKAIVTANGLAAGTVGGGKVEAKCIDWALSLLQRSEPLAIAERVQTFHWNLQRDVGMSCGGEVSFLFEVIAPPHWRVVVFGAGHVAQRLARLLRTLQCRATLVDSRKEWLDRLPQNAGLEIVHDEEPKNYIQALKASAVTDPMFVIMTRGHATDVPVLREVLKHYPNSPYVGVIGSKVKAIKIKNEMRSEGFSSQQVDSIRCPMGLVMASNDPAEIAISIAAELLQVRAQASLAQALENKTPVK